MTTILGPIINACVPEELPQDEEAEWSERRKCTGLISKLAFYAPPHFPRDDLTLRGGVDQPMTVTYLRFNGVAALSGVRVGDRLVSINGAKDFLKLPAADVLATIKPPSTLIFVGFVGKFKAEVRLAAVEEECGFDERQTVMGGKIGGNATRVKLCHACVFQNYRTSIFFKIAEGEEATSSRENYKLGEKRHSLLEVSYTDAKRMVNGALRTLYGSNAPNKLPLPFVMFNILSPGEEDRANDINEASCSAPSKGMTPDIFAEFNAEDDDSMELALV